MATIRWGVLSTANIGMTKVTPAIQQGHNCEVVAIASRDQAAAEQAAAALGIPKAFGAYEALLVDPDIDAVYIPLPNHLHAEWSIKAAAAGKHILCEKPLALTAAQATEMVEAAAAAGVKLQEAFMYRHHPSWERVRELIGDGEIGELRAVQAWFSYFNDDPDNIRNIAEFGGGTTMDIGCYPIHVSRSLFGTEPTDVESMIRRDPIFGTDIVTSVVMEFPGGGQAAYVCSTQTESYQRVHIAGSEGRIEVEIPFNIPPDRETRIFLTHGGDPPVAPNTETITFSAADQYTLQAELFAQSLLDGAEIPAPPADAVANMAVIERVLAGG